MQLYIFYNQYYIFYYYYSHTQYFLLEDNISHCKLCSGRIVENSKPDQLVNQSVNSSNLLVSTIAGLVTSLWRTSDGCHCRDPVGGRFSSTASVACKASV